MKAGNACLQNLFWAGVFSLFLHADGGAQVRLAPSSSHFSRVFAKAPAFNEIAGSLPDTIKARKTPYLVVGDIEVPRNKTVIVEKGVVFLFKAFTGVQVLGKLDVRGTADARVIFTSENDLIAGASTSLHPVAYDWNGVYIHACSEGSSMAFCSVKYSVYGIVSETKFVGLSGITFTLNGKSDVVIDSKKQAVLDKPFWYKDPSAIDPLTRKRAAFRYTGVAVTLVAGAGSIYYAMQLNKAQVDLNRISSHDQLVLYQIDSLKWRKAQTTRNNFRWYTIASGALAALGMIGVGWTFTF